MTIVELSAADASRARAPDEWGYAVRDGVRVYWEAFGRGERTVLLLPTWSIVHSRLWKAQIPYLARHFRVVTFDGRGNGRSDRPAGAEAYSKEQFTADTVAVMDATGTDGATLVALSCGALWATLTAAEHPGRVEGIVYINPAVSLAPGHPERQVYAFDDEYDVDEGWALYNSHAWEREYRRFLDFFFAECCNEAHSTKQIEDCVGWALDTTPEVLADTTRGIGWPGTEPFEDLCARIACPTLVIHGDQDRIRPLAQGAALAEATRGRLVVLEGSGHLPQARDPVEINLLIRDFVAPAPPPRVWRRARSRPRRALYLSSPIGLGHARRDLAIADELRRLHPGLQIDWLAQEPVRAVLAAREERIHSASADLAGEAEHIEAESAEHDLPVFEAIRRMDEILASNFMVFHDLVQEEPYDVWIGDEAWELDYFLHENPGLKSAPYVWLSDFVGFLPMADGGERERALTADYNAEMLEQIARYPRVRDRSIFIGDPDDIVAGRFGPGLPEIRSWTEEHFAFAGYVTGFDPAALPDRGALRAELGYAPDERVCIVTVGGSGVGTHLLTRVMSALPEAQRLVPGLRAIVVAGPRIDPASLPALDGVEVKPYVHDLHRHLAACDLAVVQGGLTTTMELTAARRPFLYFPLRRHFEQNHHVVHRLERYGAGRRMDYASDGPDAIARAMAEEIGREVRYRPVNPGGAARTAALIGELL